MCRLTFYQGSPLQISALITEPHHSLIHQSTKSREKAEPLNGDGFGLAWYDFSSSPVPARFRSITPAWSNRNLRELSQVITSKCILAHIRAATQQMEVMESNCHPFKNGPISFMHNGEIGGFSKIRRHLLSVLTDEGFQSIHGTTDSEHFFALFMDNLRDQTSRALLDSMRTTILQVVDMVEKHGAGDLCYFNFVLTNGHSSLAVRFTTDTPEKALSLYLNYGKKYICENGVCHMLEDPGDERAILVCSEPLTEDGRWEHIPPNHMVLIEEGRLVKFVSI